MVSKSFGRVRALADVDLEFPEDGIVAIIGPNGAGKTTLLNVLTGFERPDAGRCVLGAHELTGLAPHKIAQLGMARTFQDLRLITQVPVLENVMLSRPSQRGERLLWAVLRFGVAAEEMRNREAALEILRFVGLEKEVASLAGEISYGQQKLLTLACALASDARILLLDEPVAGLHPELVDRIVRLLGRLRDSGKLVVFIEHDLAAVRAVADGVVVMDEGHIIAEGCPADVLGRPEIMEAYVA